MRKRSHRDRDSWVMIYQALMLAGLVTRASRPDISFHPPKAGYKGEQSWTGPGLLRRDSETRLSGSDAAVPPSAV